MIKALGGIYFVTAASKTNSFIGIGGYGMSALAHVLLKLGYQVSGSTLKNRRLPGASSQREPGCYFRSQPGKCRRL